jgi:hypothetical protein
MAAPRDPAICGRRVSLPRFPCVRAPWASGPRRVRASGIQTGFAHPSVVKRPPCDHKPPCRSSDRQMFIGWALVSTVSPDVHRTTTWRGRWSAGLGPALGPGVNRGVPDDECFSRGHLTETRVRATARRHPGEPASGGWRMRDPGTPCRRSSHALRPGAETSAIRESPGASRGRHRSIRAPSRSRGPTGPFDHARRASIAGPGPRS